MIQLPIPSSGCSHDKPAIGNRIGHGGKLLRTPEQGRSTDGGLRFPKRQSVRIHNPQIGKGEIAHRAGSGTEV